MLSIHIQRIEACTRAVYIGPDNLIVTGRIMDWKEDIMSNLYVFREVSKEQDITRERR